jgi:alpha-ketoglutarate-dependent taurine dioxygenase
MKDVSMEMLEALADQISLVNDVIVSFDSGIAVVTPKTRKDFDFLAEFATSEKERLIALVQRSGAVILRGFEVFTGEQYSKLTGGCLGLTSTLSGKNGTVKASLMNAIYAWSKRPSRGAGVFDLPPADLQMQGPHNEVGWRSRRPRFISLWCEEPPFKAGETALFDMAAAYDNLDDELRGYFDNFASEYPAFGEKFAEDSVLIHPTTQRRCLVLWYYQSPLADHAVIAYRDTDHYQHSTIKDTVPFVAIHSSLCHIFCNGAKRIKLSNELSVRLMRHVYRAAYYIEWEKGDVVLVDNITTAHARMPCVPPRKIVVGYWNEVDVRQYTANRDVPTDDCPTMAQATPSFGHAMDILVDAMRGRLRL